MRKITTQEVQKALYERRTEAIAGTLSLGMVLMPYNYGHFEKDMYADGFIADGRTIMQKWKILQADNIVIEKKSSTRGVQTYLDLSRFRSFMSGTALSLLAEAEAGGERHTHINSVNEEVDA